MPFLDTLKQGWHFRAKNKGTGKWRSQNRFHFFLENCQSACGKYEIEEYQKESLLSAAALSKDDMCQLCVKKLCLEEPIK